MLTKNGKRLLAANVTCVPNVIALVPLYKTNGTETYVRSTSNLIGTSSASPGIIPLTSAPAMYNGGSSYAGVLLGTGTTPATENDYVLEAPFSDSANQSNFNIARNSYTIEINNGFSIQRIKFTITNKSSTSRTFSEMGFMMPFAYGAEGTQTNTSTSTIFLTERSVFAPITLAPAESVQFEWTLTMELLDKSAADYTWSM